MRCHARPEKKHGGQRSGAMKMTITTGGLSGLHVTDVRGGRIRVEGVKACTVCHVTLLSDRAEMLKSADYGACYRTNNH